MSDQENQPNSAILAIFTNIEKSNNEAFILDALKNLNKFINSSDCDNETAYEIAGKVEDIIFSKETNIGAKCFKIIYSISKHEPEKALKTLMKIAERLDTEMTCPNSKTFKSLVNTTVKILEDHPEKSNVKLIEELLKERSAAFPGSADARLVNGEFKESRSVLERAFEKASQRQLKGETGPTLTTKVKRLCKL